jgi:Flp pilus assembly pilin Flp
MVTPRERLRADESGAAMVEMAIVLPLLLTLLLGFVDFGYAFYQWNAANKAVQVGARFEGISDPVALGLLLEAGTPSIATDVGAAVPPDSYHYVCKANLAGAASCSCSGQTCHNLTPSQNQTAFDTIYAGDDLVCEGTSNPGRPGMCDFFPGLPKSEVQIEYIATGLGYWTRPGGPVTTIRVSIVNHSFQFFFVSCLLNLVSATIKMPDMLSTVTGEDLSTPYPPS